MVHGRFPVPDAASLQKSFQTLPERARRPLSWPGAMLKVWQT
jgi:hypothetical protein